MEEDYFGAIIDDLYGDNDPLLNLPPDPKCEPDPRGLGCFFMDKLKEYAEKMCQIELDSGRTQTYEEVMLDSIRVAEEMNNRGVTSDDLISICCTNRLEQCLPFLAALYLNVKIASLDPTLSLSDCVYMLNMVKPKLIFVGLESEKLIESAINESGVNTEIVVFGETEDHVPFSEFLISSGNEEGFEPVTVDDLKETAIIFFSSGTTGMPKGIMLSHYGLLSQNMLLSMERTEQVTLHYTTLYWISGVMLLIVTIFNGSLRILASKFHPVVMMKAIQDMKVEIVLLAPILTYYITQNPQLCTMFDTSSLRSLIIGGGPIGEEQVYKLRKLLPHTVIGNIYGMTEASGAVTVFTDVDKDLAEKKPLSCGKPLPGFKYRVLDMETGQILGPNQQGELRIMSDYLMNGYYNDPEGSKGAWDEDGYLITGDVGYYDEDYCFYIEDRVKDLLKYQSWHVVPAELEAVLLEHPAIKEVVVLGLPDEVDGDLPMAVVVLKPDQTATEEEIIAYMDGKVSDRKRLRGGVRFIDRIPLTPSGKMRRRDIRTMVLNNEI